MSQTMMTRSQSWQSQSCFCQGQPTLPILTAIWGAMRKEKLPEVPVTAYSRPGSRLDRSCILAEATVWQGRGGGHGFPRATGWQGQSQIYLQVPDSLAKIGAAPGSGKGRHWGQTDRPTPMACGGTEPPFLFHDKLHIILCHVHVK